MVQQTRCGDVVNHGPITAIAQFDRRKVYCVEIDVILTHELVKLHVARVKPPLFPIRGIICRYAGVSNWCVKLCAGLNQNGRDVTYKAYPNIYRSNS